MRRANRGGSRDRDGSDLLSSNQLVLEIARAARLGPDLLGDSRLITIDGPAGGGKSTLARRLEVVLGETDDTAATSSPTASRHSPPGNDFTTECGAVATIHLDDMYEGWTGLNSELFHRLEAWVILPLANSLAARFLVYDWAQARFARWAEIRPARFVIIEGVGAGDAVTRVWATTKVWLDVSDETGRRRGLARDAASQPESLTGARMSELWSLWQKSQATYFAAAGNRAAADFCVDSNRQ